MSDMCVGILSPGDMGHVVGARLAENGVRVVAALADRSPRTRALAEQSGIEDLGSVDRLVTEADLILSILVPAAAQAAADKVADAMERSGADLLYADCNAIAPHTTRAIGERIERAGGTFVDGSIIGPPPRRDGSTRIYISGPGLAPLLTLNEKGLTFVSLGDEIGQASAIKMCYAALTKGLSALSLELLIAARSLGVYDALRNEFETSQKPMLERMERGLPNVPPKAGRWIGEMEEIASTFESVGLTPKMLEGAAEMYRLVSEHELAGRNPEDETPAPKLDEMIRALASLDEV